MSDTTGQARLWGRIVKGGRIVRSETEKMTRQLAELNQVYARLLQAMTVNMGYHPQGGYPQQPTYQQPYQQPYGYPQQPQAPYNPPMK